MKNSKWKMNPQTAGLCRFFICNLKFEILNFDFKAAASRRTPK